MLIAAISAFVRTEITERALAFHVDHAAQILFKVMCYFHPGDTNDRINILQKVISPSPCGAAVAAAQELRRWKDAQQRELSLGLSMPDVFQRFLALWSMVDTALRSDEFVLQKRNALWMSMGLPDKVSETSLNAYTMLATDELNHMAIGGPQLVSATQPTRPRPTGPPV